MAEVYKKISEFPGASMFGDTDLLLISQSEVTKNVAGSEVKTYVIDAVQPYMDAAEDARDAAITAKVAAESAESNALTYKNNASASASQASTYSSDAAASAQEAENAATAMQECAPYSSAKAYVVGNMATYNGSTYRCQSNCTGVVPTNATYWLVIAAKGQDGSGAGDMQSSTYDPAGGARQVAFSDDLTSHTGNTSNPHSVTKSQVGLGNVTNVSVYTVVGRTTNVDAADANYTTYMARGESLNSAETTPTVNGTIAWTYE